MIPIIYPYKLGSKSAKNLAEMLGTRRVKPNGRYVPEKRHVIVSLGAQTIPNWANIARERGVEVINIWNNLELAQNKLTALRILKENGVAVPAFTSSREEARSFFTQRRSVVFCRTLLRAHGGRGIVIARSPEELVHAPLYTKYFPKEKEFRVHVFKGKVIDIAQKRLVNQERRANIEEARNRFVRNLENGWIYAREGVTLNDNVKQACIKACSLLKLDFGAVDCAVDAEGNYVIFEVNTAPGLEGTTLRKYADAIRQYIWEKEQQQRNQNAQGARNRFIYR